MNHLEPAVAVLRGASQADWPPTRAEALSRMDAFRPRMGGAYARTRNFDLGPDRRENVSMLSPYVRRKLLTEQELVAASVSAHGATASEKFVQEVFWRSYWKGWLEMRPSVWIDYRRGVPEDRSRLDREGAAALEAASEGRTGVACFDGWARELVETGWLHNHARMWFASIWIFTLRLPWRLGADFFLRHLLDGDPASNTLGWRWVAGLHTPGKNYVASAWNIEKFTCGRLQPAPGTLNENAAPLAGDDPPPSTQLTPAARPVSSLPTALLLTEEDLLPETLGLDLPALTGVGALQMTAARSDAPVSPLVSAFDRGALSDAAVRAQAAGAPAAERLMDVAACDLARWAARCGARQIVTGWAPVGPVREFLDAARPALRSAGAELVMVRRPWDDAVWPHATAGFFRMKQKIPQFLAALV